MNTYKNEITQSEQDEFERHENEFEYVEPKVVDNKPAVNGTQDKVFVEIGKIVEVEDTKAVIDPHYQRYVDNRKSYDPYNEYVVVRADARPDTPITGVPLTGATSEPEAITTTKVVFDIRCVDVDGDEKWSFAVEGEMINKEKARLMEVGLEEFTESGWHIGLKKTGGHAGETMVNHRTWTEIRDYDESNRPFAFNGDVAVFVMSERGSVQGAFVATDNIKGGSSGELVAFCTMESEQQFVPDDEIEVTVNVEAW